jgi:hypothetical protein
MKKILLAVLFLPFFTLAQTGELFVGDQTIVYDARSEQEFGTLYFLNEQLVASQHETVTIIYEDDRAVLEAFDTNADGALDVFVALDTEDEVISITGERASYVERPVIREFADRLATDVSEQRGTEDLVGSLDAITIPGQGVPVLPTLLLLGVLGGGYWGYKKYKQFTAEVT